ncbi:MAG: hypothetical protein KDA33_02855 [Phycisphaerales bacterium]|nr:hypothetical protein [Phycisphaerales bacterium]
MYNNDEISARLSDPGPMDRRRLDANTRLRLEIDDPVPDGAATRSKNRRDF